jgi:hypothetical protein
VEMLDSGPIPFSFSHLLHTVFCRCNFTYSGLRGEVGSLHPLPA